MAFQQTLSQPVVVENFTVLGKSAAAVAAASLLVINSYAYVPGKDVQRAPQAKVFSEPETFPQAWRGSFVVVTAPFYNYKVDIQRASQAKVFSEPEVFAQQQRGYDVLTRTYTKPAQQFNSQNHILVENQATFRGQKATLIALQVTVTPSGVSDLFVSQETFIGWPENTFYPDTFPQQWGIRAVLRDSFPVYSWQTDVQRQRQPNVVFEPESFAQQWRTSVVVVNGFPHYNPATDVRRQGWTYVFSDYDNYIQPAPFNQLVINGKAYVPPTPPAPVVVQPYQVTEPWVQYTLPWYWTFDHTSFTFDSTDTQWTFDGGQPRGGAIVTQLNQFGVRDQFTTLSVTRTENYPL